MQESINILAIESSCDDTSAAVLQDGKILANHVANQAIHQKYGGVVPELASRAHQQNIVPVVETALQDAGILMSRLSAIAYTQGPGLMGSLLVGSSFAKGLSLSLGIPLIGIHHMDAHVMAHFIDEPFPGFPFMCLVVSGGHTQLVLVEADHSMKLIGKTTDDAAGEAFDKTAKLLGLPYPGGPLIDKYAKDGDPHAFIFPNAKTAAFNFSFSGLKTSILYFLQKRLRDDPDFIQKRLPDICASVQFTIVEYLVEKLQIAASQHGVKHIGISGGVSANSLLRTRVAEIAELNHWNSYIPKMEYCTDNAAMIAISGYYKYLRGAFSGLMEKPFAR